MAKRKSDPELFLPLTPAMFHILLALADRERHGYHIMQEVDERTEGKVRLGPGTLYGSIKRMLADGMIEETDERPDPERLQVAHGAGAPHRSGDLPGQQRAASSPETTVCWAEL